ncbi:hypothetical protein D3C71_1821310 [compost metagenome]
MRPRRMARSKRSEIRSACVDDVDKWTFRSGCKAANACSAGTTLAKAYSTVVVRRRVPLS